MDRVAIVTGANRGIGFEITKQLACEGFQVFAGARNADEGKKAEDELRREELVVPFLPLDVTSEVSCNRFVDEVLHRGGSIDVLVNNAGIIRDMDYFSDKENGSVLKADIEAVKQTFEVNTLAPLRMCQLVVPHMKEHNFGRIINVSSGMGLLSEMNGGFTGYRMSKTALNALTCILADELLGTNITVNSACPGWARTRLGGETATRSAAEGAETIVWFILQIYDRKDGGPTGKFMRDKQEVSW